MWVASIISIIVIIIVVVTITVTVVVMMVMAAVTFFWLAVCIKSVAPDRRILSFTDAIRSWKWIHNRIARVLFYAILRYNINVVSVEARACLLVKFPEVKVWQRWIHRFTYSWITDVSDWEIRSSTLVWVRIVMPSIVAFAIAIVVVMAITVVITSAVVVASAIVVASTVVMMVMTVIIFWTALLIKFITIAVLCCPLDWVKTLTSKWIFLGGCYTSYLALVHRSTLADIFVPVETKFA